MTSEKIAEEKIVALIKKYVPRILIKHTSITKIAHQIINISKEYVEAKIKEKETQ